MAAVLLALLLLGAYVVDDRLHDRELARLVAQVRAGQATVAYADGRVTATVRYTQPLLGSARTPARVREGLLRLVADEAAGQVQALADARADVRRLRVLPWHRGITRARLRYVAYLQARVDHLRAGAADGRVLLRRHPASERALVDAERALVGAGVTPAVARAALSAT